MINTLSLITDIGFTENEARIYMCLLRNKFQSIVEIGKSTELQRPTVYTAIHKLEKFGLISKTVQGKRTLYGPAHPRRLLQIINLKQNFVDTNIHILTDLYETGHEKPKVQVLEGIEAVDSVYQDALERLQKGEEIRIFGNVESVSKKFPEVLKSYAKIIGSFVYKAKVFDLMLDNAAAHEYAKSIKDKIKKNYQLRFVNKDKVFGFNEQYILKDKIIYFSLAGSAIFVVTIENSDLVMTQRAMFDVAWEQSRDAFEK